MNNQALGQAGEALACKYLSQKGFIILRQNLRLGKAEIDIVALDGDYIVFVEVKTRSSHQFGSPLDAIGNKKQEMMIEAACKYIEDNNISKHLRFDVIGITISQGKHHIKHIRQAFHPQW